MKKFLQMSTVLFGMLFVQNGYSEEMTAYNQNQGSQFRQGVQGYSQGFQGSQGDSCADACPPDQACGDCYCLYVHYEPCYYTTRRCVEEQIPCKKRCCRTVPKYYQVQRCRYVPQYYCDTVCRNEVEYYEVDDCKCCKKWVCDQHCKYVPRYYWKHVCGENAAAVSGCATGSCSQ